MLNLLVFAVVGLLAGTAARMFYPGRQPARVLGTLVLGLVGALGGGVVSWLYWPPVEDQLHSGNLVLSMLGALTVIGVWAGVTYARSLGGARNTST